MLITLSLVYAKVTVYFYVTWSYILSPMILYFTLNILMTLWQTFSIMQQEEQDQKQTQLDLIWALSKFMLNGLFGGLLIYAGIIIENIINAINSQQDAEQALSGIDIQAPINNIFIVICLALLVYLIYSVLTDYLVGSQNVGGIDIVSNILLSALGQSTTVCAGGACNSFYISTLSAFFSAFGVPITKYIHYLNFLCIILLGSSLVSMYSVKRTWMYGPFILTLIGVILILGDLFLYDCKPLSYCGNVLIIGSAFWNSKLHKFRWGSSQKSV